MQIIQECLKKIENMICFKIIFTFYIYIILVYVILDNTCFLLHFIIFFLSAFYHQSHIKYQRYYLSIVIIGNEIEKKLSICLLSIFILKSYIQ